jgi:hypothetical protein
VRFKSPLLQTQSATYRKGFSEFNVATDIIKLNKLGDGSCGIVWKVVDTRSHEIYALKVPPPPDTH